MGFTEAIQECFNKFADFNGRARRSEYWYWVLFSFLVNAASAIVGNMLKLTFLISIVGLAVFIPTLAVSVRRLHDTGKSGWLYLIGLIPVVGWILLLIWFVTDSQPGENMYGPNPKEPKYDGGAFGGDGFGM